MTGYRATRHRAYAIAAATTAAVAMLTAACSTTSAGGTGGGGGKPVIGFTDQFIAGNTWLATLAKGAQKYGAAHGYNVVTADAQGDPQQQNQQITTFINEGVKAIIVEPVNATNIAPSIAAAKRAKIPIIVVNDKVSPDLQKQVYCNVSDDAEVVGKLVGQATAKAVGQRYKPGQTIKLYVAALFPRSPVTEQRENGFMAGFNGYFQSHPGPHVVRIPDQYDQALPDTTLTVMRGVISGNPDLNVIFNQTDVVYPAIQTALRGAHLMDAAGHSNIIIAGFDGGMSVIEALANDSKTPLVATGLNEPGTQAADAVQEAMAAAKGKASDCTSANHVRILPPLVVTPQNAKQYVDPSLAFAGPLTPSK